MADEKTIVTKKTAPKAAATTKKTAAKKAAPTTGAAAPSAAKKATPAAAAPKAQVKPSAVPAKAAPVAPAKAAPATKAPAKASAATGRSKKTTATASAGGTRAMEGKSISLKSLANVSDEERLHMVHEAAYYRAEKRQFAPGHEVEDWAEAEREINELIASAKRISGR